MPPSATAAFAPPAGWAATSPARLVSTPTRVRGWRPAPSGCVAPPPRPRATLPWRRVGGRGNSSGSSGCGVVGGGGGCGGWRSGRGGAPPRAAADTATTRAAAEGGVGGGNGTAPDAPAGDGPDVSHGGRASPSARPVMEAATAVGAGGGVPAGGDGGGAPVPLHGVADMGVRSRGAAGSGAGDGHDGEAPVNMRTAAGAAGAGEDEEEEEVIIPKSVSKVDVRVLAGVTVGIVTAVLVAGTLASRHVSADTLGNASDWIQDLGPLGPVVYGLAYFLLELVAVPALPLTVGAGYLFGVGRGSAVVSVAATSAAAASFLLARYGARDFISGLARRYPKFRAVDRAVGREGFKFVLLLRLSPLLPFALSNYLYGLTSVRFWPYVLGSWLGMLPGSVAIVSGGAAVNALSDLSSRPEVNPGLIGLGLIATVLVLRSIGKLASVALSEDEGTADPVVAVEGGNGEPEKAAPSSKHSA